MKKLFCLFLFAFYLIAKSQPLGCAVQSLQPGPGTCSISCSDYANYLPTAVYGGTFIVRLNFWYLRPMSGSGIYDAVTQTDVDSIVKKLNRVYDSLYAPTLTYSSSPPPAYVKRPKIKFVCNSFNQPNSPYYIWNNGWQNPFPISSFTTTQKAMNIIYHVRTTTVGAAASGRMAEATVRWPLGSTDTYYPGALEETTLAHELGHVMGLSHTNEGYTSNPCNDLDTSYFGGAVCGTWPTTVTNNIMGGNGACPHYLSPWQISRCRFDLANDPLLSQTCTYIPSNTITATNYTLTGNQTLSSLAPFGTITIASGASITFQGALLIPHSTLSRITVQKGAQLYLNCTKIYGGGWWSGIEVLGTSTATQNYVDQGYLEMYNSEIYRARRAIALGKISSNGLTMMPGLTGGGWVVANYCKFSDNLQVLETLPVNNSNQDNLTSFTDCDFIISTNVEGLFQNHVRLNGVRGIKFYGCNFDMGKKFESSDTLFCIKGINSSVIIDEGSYPAFFEKADYGVYMLNSPWKNTIQKSTFRTRNGIYLSNSNYSKLVRNGFEMHFMQPYGVLNTGLYLNECSNYKVENNNFYGNNVALTEGICINKSGINSNQIYNNKFFNLSQSAWCQNNNLGLKLNCNNFNGGTYNIGVQGGAYYPSNTGIAYFQGVSGQNDTLNVRNTYTNTSCGNRNKYYTMSQFGVIPQVQHGNFVGAEFGVDPQPSCSDASEIINIQINPPTLSPSGYCYDYSSLPAQKHFYSSGIGVLAAQIFSYQTQLTQPYIETSRLINYMKYNTVSGNPLRDTLLSKPFLTDSVMYY